MQRRRYGRPRAGQVPREETEQMEYEEEYAAEEMGTPPEQVRGGRFGPAGRAQAGVQGGLLSGRFRPELPAQTPSEQWMLTSLDLLQLLCERCNAAAQARPLAPATSEGEEAEKLMLELRPEANLVAQYQLDLPQAVADKLSEVALGNLRLRYVRTEETAVPNVVAGFYRRKMSAPRMHQWGKLIWIESLRRVPQTDRVRSIDVLITAQGEPPAPEPGLSRSRREQGVPVVVEILCLELKDPAPPEEEESESTTGA